MYRILTHISFQIQRRKQANAPPRVFSFLPNPLGSILGFAQPIAFIKDSMKKYGDTFTAHVLGKDLTFVTHPKDMDAIFSATDEQVSQREVYKFMTPVFGKGVVYDAKNTQRMMEQLHFVISGLRKDRFSRFVQIFEEETDIIINQLGESGEIELFEILSKLIIFTASRSLLGEGVRHYLQDKNLADLYHNIDEGISPLSFFFPNFPMPSSFSRNKAVKEVYQIFTELINERRKNPEKAEGNQDVLEILMNAQYRDKVKVPDSHICGILLAGLFAGQHTSSITSTWTLMNLLFHPHILKRVMEEQKEVMDSLDDQLTYDKVRAMHLLENCMNEALRMYPPLIMLMRYCKENVKCGNYVIPKGNIIVISTSVSGRHKDVFTEPDKYDPDRFDRLEQKKFNHSDLLFGSGRHKCLGENFARLQITSICSKLLRAFEFTPVDKKLPNVDYTSLVAGPGNKCFVRYKKRTSW